MRPASLGGGIQKGQAMKKTITIELEFETPVVIALEAWKEREKERMAYSLKNEKKDMAKVCEKFIQEIERVLEAIKEAPWEP